MDKSIIKKISAILILSMIISVMPIKTDTSYGANNINVSRVRGNDRYETSVNISKLAKDSGTNTVVLASGENFADSLTAGALAGQVDGVLLLTSKNKLPSNVKSEINRLKPQKAYIVGGSNSISDNVAKEIGVKYSRIAGSDRYKTSDLVTEEVIRQGGSNRQLILANGRDFPDSLSGSAYGAMTGIPVALSNNHVPSVAKNKKVTIIGGINSVNAKPENSVRWSGKNRYRTSLEVAKGGYKNPSTVILASGEKYADALSASNIANRYNAPLLLMSKNSMDSEIISYIKTNINRVIVVGGEDSITNKVLQVLGGDIGNIEKPETKPEEKPTPPNTNNIEELKKYELGTLSEAQAWKLYEATPTPNPATDPAYLSMLEDGPKGVRFGHNEIKVVSGNEFIGKMPDGTYRKVKLGAVKNPLPKGIRTVQYGSQSFDNAKEFLQHLLEGGVRAIRPNPPVGVTVVGISTIDGKDISGLVSTKHDGYLQLDILGYFADYDETYKFVDLNGTQKEYFYEKFSIYKDIPSVIPENNIKKNQL